MRFIFIQHFFSYPLKSFVYMGFSKYDFLIVAFCFKKKYANIYCDSGRKKSNVLLFLSRTLFKTKKYLSIINSIILLVTK